VLERRSCRSRKFRPSISMRERLTIAVFGTCTASTGGKRGTSISARRKSAAGQEPNLARQAYDVCLSRGGERRLHSDQSQEWAKSGNHRGSKSRAFRLQSLLAAQFCFSQRREIPLSQKRPASTEPASSAVGQNLHFSALSVFRNSMIRCRSAPSPTGGKTMFVLAEIDVGLPIKRSSVASFQAKPCRPPE
jgi:hypothetical protein